MPANIDLFINGTDKTAPAINSAKAGMDGLASQAGGVSNQLTAMGVAIGTTIGNLATSAITKLGEMVGSIATTGLTFNNMKEQATIAFTTMLGDGGKAKSFLDDLASFAAKTPFEFPDLLTASQRMLAMGFQSNQVLPTLTAIGDAVAGLGGNSALVDRVTTALGQMQAKGKATGEEMMQLTEAGIPAWEFLAKKIGVSIPEAMDMVSKGAVSADIAIGALVDGMNTKFGGLMEKQSATFGGLLSTISDTFQQISGKVMKPLFDQLTRGLQMIVDWTSSPAFTAGIEKFTSFMQKLGTATGVFFDYIDQGLPPLTALTLALHGVLPSSLFDIWYKFHGVIFDTTRFVKSLFGEAKRFEDDSPMTRYLLDLGDMARETFQSMFSLSGKVIEKLWDWAERVTPVLIESMAKFFDVMERVWDAVKALASPITEAIGQFVKLDDVMGALAVFLAGPALSALWGMTTAFIAFAAPIAGPIALITAGIAGLRLAWQNDFGQIRTITSGFLRDVTNWIGKESGIWIDSFDDFLDYLDWFTRGGWKNYFFFPIRSFLIEIRDDVELWVLTTKSRFDKWVTDVGNTVNDWKNTGIAKVSEWYTKTIDFIEHWKNEAERKIDYFVGRADTIFTFWKNKIVRIVEDWRDDIIDRFQPVIDWWETHIDPWIQIGIDWIQGLWDGVEKQWDLFNIWWQGKWNGIVTWVKDLLGIASPSKLFRNYGQYIMEGLGAGIEAYKNVPLTYMDSVINSLTGQMERLKGAVVQNVFDINQAASQLKLDPATLPTWMGGTGKVVGVGPNGELIMEGINKLPAKGGGSVVPTGIGAIGTTTAGVMSGIGLAEALGLNKISTLPESSVADMLGGFSLTAINLADAKQKEKDAKDKASKSLQEYIQGIGDFITQTLTGSKSVFNWFNMQESNAKYAGKLKEYLSSETAQTKNDLRDLYQGLQNSFADILGISTSELNVTGADSKRLIDRIGQLMSGTNAQTDIDLISGLLQTAVDFRNLANYGTGASYYKDVLPTDSRLTGGDSTVNNYNITLQGSNNANADVLGLVELLGSLQGVSVP